MFMYEEKDLYMNLCTDSLLFYIYSSQITYILTASLYMFMCVCVIPQETGFWFIFHHVPTGPSEGLYSPGHTEHIPMGHFTNNRAHSNYRVSLGTVGSVMLV